MPAEGVGRFDGGYEMEHADLSVTDWNSGSSGSGMQTAAIRNLRSASRERLVPNADGLPVVEPELVKSELRLIRLRE